MYSDTIVLSKKDIVLFADSTPREMKMKDINSKIKRGRIHQKSLPGTKSKTVESLCGTDDKIYKWKVEELMF